MNRRMMQVQFIVACCLIFPFFTFAQNAPYPDSKLPFEMGQEMLEEKLDSNVYLLMGAYKPNGDTIIYQGNGYREYYFGDVSRRYYYRNGRSSGLVIMSSISQSRIIRMGYYYGDFRDGLWLDFHPNGQIASSVEFDSGHVVSQKSLFYENAKLKAVFDVDDNEEMNGVYTEFYESGLIKLKGQYAMVRCIAEGIDSNDLSNKWYFEPRSVRVGAWKEYHENGTVKSEYQFDSTCHLMLNSITNDNGFTVTSSGAQECPIGRWVVYDENGTETKVTLYKDCLKKDE